MGIMRATLLALYIAAGTALRMQLGGATKTKLLVIGGNGFVGREVCKYAVQNGYAVTSLSRRGQCPDPQDEILSQVEWQAGNALDQRTVDKYVNDADAVVNTARARRPPTCSLADTAPCSAAVAGARYRSSLRCQLRPRVLQYVHVLFAVQA